MVFHVRYIFLTTSLQTPSESLAHMENHPKCIFPHTLQRTLIMLNTLCKVEDHENHVRWIYLTTVLYMG